MQGQLNVRLESKSKIQSLSNVDGSEDRSFLIFMVLFPLINVAICFAGGYAVMLSYSKSVKIEH